MTRKDFELIAAAIALARPLVCADDDLGEALVHQWKQQAKAQADTLAKTNPRFDRTRFLAAAGVL